MKKVFSNKAGNHILMILVCLFIFACKNTSEENKTETLAAVQIQELTSPVSGNSWLPRLFATDGILYMSWVERRDTVAHLKYAILQNDNWSPSSTVISGSDWFVNWADFPAIAEVKGRILTSFLQKSDSGTYTYDVKLNLYSNDTWKKNFILHDDGTKSEHGFVTIKPYTGNSFMVTWLDGRNTVGNSHGAQDSHDAHSSKGAMTLRAAIVFEDGTIDYDTLLDERICDCCQTTAAIGPDDEIVIAYRDRSEDEIRDISVVRWDKQNNWSQPQTIGSDNWKIAGCPVNGPSMDSFKTSLGLSWFTAHSGEGEVNVVFSDDVGKNFGETIRIDAGNATGRVDLVMLNEQEAAVLWMEPNGEDELIQLIKVNLNGEIGNPVTIAKTSAERASGFPQLERVENDLYIAWTVASSESNTVEIAKISIDNL